MGFPIYACYYNNKFKFYKAFNFRKGFITFKLLLIEIHKIIKSQLRRTGTYMV